jgi:hypothetical protein
MTELSPGVVSVADLYRELVGLRSDVVKALTRIEALDTTNQLANEIHHDHEVRLRALESFRWKLAGACLTVSVLAGGAGTWVGLVVGRGR